MPEINTYICAWNNRHFRQSNKPKFFEMFFIRVYFDGGSIVAIVAIVMRRMRLLSQQLDSVHLLRFDLKEMCISSTKHF